MGGRQEVIPPARWLGEYSSGPPDDRRPGVPAASAEGGAGARSSGGGGPGPEIHYRWDRRSFRSLLRGSELLFGNRSEIARALEFVGAHRPEGLLEFVPLVIRTEGRAGATAFSRAGTVHVGATRPARVRTLVGAGDAFRGGFYAGWFAGQPLYACLTAGTRSSARWIEGTR